MLGVSNNFDMTVATKYILQPIDLFKCNFVLQIARNCMYFGMKIKDFRERLFPQNPLLAPLAHPPAMPTTTTAFTEPQFIGLHVTPPPRTAEHP